MIIVVIDSDGLIGSLDVNDVHHKNTLAIIEKLRVKNVKFVCPVTTIAETVTFLQGRLNSPELAAEALLMLNNGDIETHAVDEVILKEAGNLMDFKKSKHNTLFDAIVLAIARKIKADAIFSFDGFYKKEGFKLASEL